jgi:catechol-2,3-dioxygenase
MKKFEVQYQGGQGRYTSEAVDYMIVTVNGIELYAEMENPTWDAEKENSR